MDPSIYNELLDTLDHGVVLILYKNHKILDRFKFKAFADDNINVTEKLKFVF